MLSMSAYFNRRGVGRNAKESFCAEFFSCLDLLLTVVGLFTAKVMGL